MRVEISLYGEDTDLHTAVLSRPVIGEGWAAEGNMTTRSYPCRSEPSETALGP